MRKNFELTATRHKPDRQVELVKSEINKYVARERRKDLPEDVDFWDFDCRCGADAKTAEAVHVSTIGKEIDKAYQAKAATVYVEIIAKPGIRLKKEKNDDFEDDKVIDDGGYDDDDESDDYEEEINYND